MIGCFAGAFTSLKFESNKSCSDALRRDEMLVCPLLTGHRLFFHHHGPVLSGTEERLIPG